MKLLSPTCFFSCFPLMAIGKECLSSLRRTHQVTRSSCRAPIEFVPIPLLFGLPLLGPRPCDPRSVTSPLSFEPRAHFAGGSLESCVFSIGPYEVWVNRYEVHVHGPQHLLSREMTSPRFPAEKISPLAKLQVTFESCQSPPYHRATTTTRREHQSLPRPGRHSRPRRILLAIGDQFLTSFGPKQLLATIV